MMKSLLVSAACLLCLTTASAVEVSDTAPNFTLPDRGGKEVSLADLKGQVVMINFWATWCGPCRTEMPKLEALYERYGDLGFTLLGVNVENDKKGAEKWLEETPVSFDILFDTRNEVSKLYDVVAMPTTVIMDKTGKVRFVHHGYQAGYENSYQSEIRSLLTE
ncbi:MAG TPA: TlpA disulfide reductase family protein [Gammaproteobacteria bacterium]|nr:TlpA disulfide reductase family protein [Gammaproteobacteria bacterium]